MTDQFDRRHAVRASGVLIALVLWWTCHAAGYADISAGPPGLPPGTLTLRVTPTSAEFRPVPGLPNTWEAGPFEVEASCPLRTWAVLLDVSALSHQREAHSISPTRIQFIPLAPRPGGGGQDAALSLSATIPVLEGGVGTRVGPTGRTSFLLRIVTDWVDPAGAYVGTIRFSQFAAP